MLPNKVLEVNAHLMQGISISLRSSYMEAKEKKKAYGMIPDVMSLQKLNGANVGNVHRSDHDCTEVTGHIANEIGTNFVSEVNKLEL